MCVSRVCVCVRARMHRTTCTMLQGVLSRIHEFLGLSDVNYDLSDDDLARVLDEHYPKFEESSGWSMNGDYGFVRS